MALLIFQSEPVVDPLCVNSVLAMNRELIVQNGDWTADLSCQPCVSPVVHLFGPCQHCLAIDFPGVIATGPSCSGTYDSGMVKVPMSDVSCAQAHSESLFSLSTTGPVCTLNGHFLDCGAGLATYQKSDAYPLQPVGTYALVSQIDSSGTHIWPSTVTVFNPSPLILPSSITVTWPPAASPTGPSSAVCPMTIGPSFFSSGELNAAQWTSAQFVLNTSFPSLLYSIAVNELCGFWSITVIAAGTGQPSCGTPILAQYPFASGETVTMTGATTCHFATSSVTFTITF